MEILMYIDYSYLVGGSVRSSYHSVSSWIWYLWKSEEYFPSLSTSRNTNTIIVN